MAELQVAAELPLAPEHLGADCLLATRGVFKVPISLNREPQVTLPRHSAWAPTFRWQKSRPIMSCWKIQRAWTSSRRQWGCCLSRYWNRSPP